MKRWTFIIGFTVVIFTCVAVITMQTRWGKAFATWWLGSTIQAYVTPPSGSTITQGTSIDINIQARDWDDWTNEAILEPGAWDAISISLNGTAISPLSEPDGDGWYKGAYAFNANTPGVNNITIVADDSGNHYDDPTHQIDYVLNVVTPTPTPTPTKTPTPTPTCTLAVPTCTGCSTSEPSKSKAVCRSEIKIITCPANATISVSPTPAPTWDPCADLRTSADEACDSSVIFVKMKEWHWFSYLDASDNPAGKDVILGERMTMKQRVRVYPNGSNTAAIDSCRTPTPNPFVSAGAPGQCREICGDCIVTLHDQFEDMFNITFAELEINVPDVAFPLTVKFLNINKQEVWSGNSNHIFDILYWRREMEFTIQRITGTPNTYVLTVTKASISETSFEDLSVDCPE